MPDQRGGGGDVRVALCDDDGIVTRGPMHHGQNYQCTGSAHFAGHHIICTNPLHRVEPGDEWVGGMSVKQAKAMDLFGFMADTLEADAITDGHSGANPDDASDRLGAEPTA